MQMLKWSAAGCAAAGVLAAAPWSTAQCPTCMGGERVNDDYTLNSTSGAYTYVANRTSSTVYNFAVTGTDGVKRSVTMADPTVMPLVINGVTWYFVTGTSEGISETNFAIYKSQDLVNWFPHMLTFSEANNARREYSGQGPKLITSYDPYPVNTALLLQGPIPSNLPGVMALIINGRYFRDMWAPQLYVDGDTVWLSFTAKEVIGIAGTCPCPGSTCDATPLIETLYYANISLSDFVGATNVFGTGSGQPGLYNYRINNTGSGRIDGGWDQGHAIPCSGDLRGHFDACYADQSGSHAAANGWLQWAGDLLQWKGFGVGGKTFMNLDSFVYVDPNDGNRRWMLYTWRANLTSDGGFNGNNVAAYPMSNHRNMDALATESDIIPLAYRYNTSNLIPRKVGDLCAYSVACGLNGCLWNGLTGVDALRLDNASCGDYAVAEGPAVFARNNRTYLLVSRNGANSPAYGIFYRFTGTSAGNNKLRNLALPDFGNISTTEYQLVSAYDRALPSGRSFGHGEVFVGPGGRYYLIYHATKDNGSGRTIFFKELRFDGQTGLMTSFTNNGSKSATDTDAFLVPR